MKHLVPIILLLAGGWLLLANGNPSTVIVLTDPLSLVYKQDRIDKVTVLREMASKVFSSDADQAEWHNTQIHGKAQAAFQGYVDAVAEAIVAGKVKDLADRLEKSR